MRFFELLNEADLNQKEQNALMVFDAFRNAGFSPTQARHLTGEIHRENGFANKYLFGTHRDPKNKATNLGMLSWQGARAPALDNYMKNLQDKTGVKLFDKNGNMLQNQDVLNAQAQFVRREMETNSHGGSRRQDSRIKDWLNNPEPSDSLSRDVIGGDFIRWRLNDPEYRTAGLNNRNAGMNILDRAASARPNASGTSTQIATATPPKSSSPTSSLRPNARPNASGTSTQIATATPSKSTLSTKGSVQNATPLPIRDMKPINYDKLSNVGTTNYNIRRGTSGDNVRQLQTKLSNMGYNIGTSGADGKFGKNTAAAVRQFQKDYNLQVDGIVGDQTMSALSQIRSTPIRPQVGGTGATSMGNIGDGTRGTNLDARDAANMAAANKSKNISYGDTMGVTTKPSKPATVTPKLPPKSPPELPRTYIT